IIEPLGMVDTGFVLPREKLSRFADVGLTEDYVSGRTVVFDQNGEQSGYLAPRPFPSGAGGLFSTVDDYLAFERMLRAGGMHNGQRVLQESWVRAMPSSQLTDAQRAASMQSASVEPGFFANHSWGYGMAVQTGAVPYQPVAGAYGWDGAMGTSVLNDPNRDLI